MKGGLSIGALAERTGSNIQTIRYYEKIGLLPEPPLTEGGQRRYGPEAVHRLAFIRHARDLGFGIEAIRELMRLAGAPNSPCVDVDQIANAHLQAVEQKIARLGALRDELQSMMKDCRKGRIAECRVMEALADPPVRKAQRQ
jgi:DNA-binding transcriptional MerR regulator